MVNEATLEKTDEGLVRRDEGWFVVNLLETQWRRHASFGDFCSFEGDVRFPHFGINVHVVAPGQPNCMYHAENAQESFLVLSGECVLIVEGQERMLKAWDFVHCAPWTKHVFVGAGSGPCAILMVGARNMEEKLLYPVEAVAQARGAGVAVETPDPREAYAGLPRSMPLPPPKAFP